MKFKRSPIKIEAILKISCTEMYRECEGTREIPVNNLKAGKSGVYEIRNLEFPTKYYIGQSKNLETRYWRHFNDLRVNKHIGKMQDDYNVFCGLFPILHEPEEIFEFRVIAFCRPSELTFYENILIKILNPYYNTHKDHPLGISMDEIARQEL